MTFFKAKGHIVFSSDSLVPQDESVFFTSAGMNQFKPYFLGEKKDVVRAASSQKCLRTADLDEVGNTPYHHTFFEMLGNFSFGDYFKKEAIEFAWEFVTKELNLEKKCLWISVFNNDFEAFDIWKNRIGVSPDKIKKLGEKDNFWPANAPAFGPNGPCGPCSEIFFGNTWDEAVEIWNLVFTQFDRTGKDQLVPLPQKNIDTGMGLERMAAVLQGTKSNFEIDILKPIVYIVEKKTGTDLKNNSRHARLVYAIVDHARAATFSISDGVFPSNEERGYVIRKLIRKACWHGYSMGVKKPFIHELVGQFAECMNKPYPEIMQNKEKISSIIRGEEEKFLFNIKGAKSQFQIVALNLKKQSGSKISSDIAFKLYDTYGLPLELTRELAHGYGLEVEEKGFHDLLKKQREISRKGSMFNDTIFTRKDYDLDDVSEFVGYSSLRQESRIIRIIKDKTRINNLCCGAEGILVLDKTPFYAISGGQCSDKGIIKTANGKFAVKDVQKIKDAIIHIGSVSEGEVSIGGCLAEVDSARRRAIMRAHTVTHLLQSVLRMVLGGHVEQQGSFVDEDRLRFDFNHFKGLSPDELRKVEDAVNRLILKGERINKEILTLKQAKSQGALAFFKDKYKSRVRVVSIANYSKELCGGTHLDFTSEAGIFCIVSESSISSGIRRIEALTGKKAYRKLAFYKDMVKRLSSFLKVKDEDVLEAFHSTEKFVKSCRERIESLQKDIIVSGIDDILKQKTTVAEIDIFIHEFKGEPYSNLLYAADLIRNRFEKAFIFFVSSYEKRKIFICAATPSLTKPGVSAGKFVNKYRDELGLKGGGRGLTAQGILLNVDDLKLIKDKVREFLLSEAGK